MNKAYNRINWENFPSIETPVNEQNLNKIDSAVDEIDNRIITFDSTRATKTEVANLVKEISFNEKNGIFTVTRKNGSKFTIDTKLEKIAVNFGYDQVTQRISLTLIDGTVQYIDLSALITQYEFLDTDTVSFFIDEGGKVSAIVKDGSITEDKLQPNYLAEIKVEAAKAESSARAADASKTAAAASAATASTKAGEAATSATNAAGSATTATEKAEEAADSADDAAASAATATQKATESGNSANAAANSATNAASSASTATEKANAASASATAAAGSATSADTYAKQAQSYAVGTGGVRPDEATDNAKYYYEQSRDISQGIGGALIPMGTVTFANLPLLINAESGWMYNVSDEFITDSAFKEGVGHVIPAGSNVYKTADGFWDVLSGSPVSGVKGNKENTYRQGNVNITPADIGAFPDVKIITAEGEDLDTFKTSGIWFFGANSKPAEYPGNDGRGWLFVMEYSTVVAKQIWLQYGTNSISADMYTRLCKADKSWSPWRRFALSDELDAGMNHFTHLYGGDSASAALNGYYKILSIPLSAVNDSSHAVIKVFAANEYNDSMFPVNLHVIPSKGVERNIFEIYADKRSAYYDQLYIKTPAGTGSGEFSLWWKRAKNYTVIAVATLGFYKKTGLNDAERWTYEFPNTPAAEIDEEGYDVTALSADANNLVFRNVPAAIADKLTTARRIDGVTFDGTGNIMHYARCNTAANVAEKTVSCPGFTLVAGAEITVLFDVANTAQNPTLNVNGTGAKTIQYHGKAATAESLSKHRTYRFSYTGATYQIVGLSEDDVFLKTSPEGNWIDRKSKTYWYGSGQNSAEQNGYYKIASIAIAQSITYTTYGIKLRITSDNFTNYAQVPTEFWVIAGKGTNTSAGAVWVYGDPNSLNSPLLKNNLFIRKETVAPSNFEIYYYREKEFGEINVEVVTEFKRLGDVSEPFVSTGIWTIHDNTKVDAIEAEGYEVTPLFDKITSVSLTIGSEQQPIYMKNGVPTPIGNSLRLKDGITSANVLRLFDDGDSVNYGGNLLVYAGSNIFVGSGESTTGLYNEYETNGASPDIVGDYYSKAGEQSYFLSDNALFFFANCNIVANRRGFGLTTGGDIIPVAPASGTKRIGTANSHWKDGFFDALHADTAESTTTFTSGDAANPTGWADIATVASGEKHSSLWRKMSLAVKNLRYLWKLMGTTSLAGIGDGTVTGALNALNTGMIKNVNNVYMVRKHADAVNSISLIIRWTDGGFVPGTRQTVFMFGTANGQPVCALITISGAGSVQNITNFTNNQVSAIISSSKKLDITLPAISYDRFVIVSSDYIA